VVGVIAWFYLVDSPAKAKWLTDAEKAWLTAELTAENEAKSERGYKHPSLRSAFTNGRVWLLCLIHFGFVYGLYTLAFFLPTSSWASRRSSGPSSSSLRRA
jgi:hypothetical protein